MTDSKKTGIRTARLILRLGILSKGMLNRHAKRAQVRTTAETVTDNQEAMHPVLRRFQPEPLPTPIRPLLPPHKLRLLLLFKCLRVSSIITCLSALNPSGSLVRFESVRWCNGHFPYRFESDCKVTIPQRPDFARVVAE